MISAATVSAQSHTFNFDDGTDQGWGLGFGDDASASFAIVNAAGSNRMVVPKGAFQSAGVATGNPGSTFYQAMLAASANEALYQVTYDWRVDTAGWGANSGTFFQLGSFVNTGSGYYAQNFGAVKEVELNGTQLASGGVFSGTVTYNMAAVLYNMPAGETFFRFGVIMNGDGSAQAVQYDNITISPVPEPASMALLGLAVPAMMIRRRRGA
ncbi:MAG: PEP-CTERM sorting domain-containing protein [Anaerolineae bacterium]|nr:PEP-CTERM sorting domain-containing protein [Phycisphaerae bacterium]